MASSKSATTPSVAPASVASTSITGRRIPCWLTPTLPTKTIGNMSSWKIVYTLTKSGVTGHLEGTMSPTQAKSDQNPDSLKILSTFLPVLCSQWARLDLLAEVSDLAQRLESGQFLSETTASRNLLLRLSQKIHKLTFLSQCLSTCLLTLEDELSSKPTGR